MSGSLPQAPYISSEQIEREAEYHLIHAKLMPSSPEPIDIVSFLELYLQVHLDQHADLPSDVLGVTFKQPRKGLRVEINRDLTWAAEDDNSPLAIKGRWRATLGHESAHVIFHRNDLEAAAYQQTLFDNEPITDTILPRQICLKRDFGQTNGTNRREIQANLGMAALLMPRSIFETAARQIAEAVKSSKVPSEQRLIAMAMRLAKLFEVSKTAAQIRIETLKLHDFEGQNLLSI